MSEMVAMLERLEPPEGFTPSRLPGVRLFKASRHLPRCPLVYNPGIVFVAQGAKIGYLGDHVFRYDAENYLVLSVAMPFECETFAEPEKPLLGFYVDVDMRVLNELIESIDPPAEQRDSNEHVLPRGIGPAPLDAEMADAAVRLLACLASGTEARVLGPGLIREVVFRALQGARAGVLYGLARHNGHLAHVARALQLIHRDYAAKLDIDSLARSAHMSASAFHRAFREVTTDSPIQYLKKIRLNKARDLMLHHGMKAYLAADEVGYESPSQFSREFKRYFGQSPAELIKASSC